ncbi:hypothetical protein MXD62_20040 [Frankia sp. Mgl5]|uniref:hypothetical protein n=1 Tax=Frankia sp. Mgl5 TaxID=2933793 RepID=UPI00200C218C|nr:hypothetical protein [Frankia sp. Mgl5]MCK9929442.1 hypothetical protein [Frankia sp. Mgl5]
MRRPRARLARPPHGLLSLAALLWLTGLLTAGVWVLAGIGWGLLAAAVVGAVALGLADEVTKPDTATNGRL